MFFTGGSLKFKKLITPLNKSAKGKESQTKEMNNRTLPTGPKKSGVKKNLPVPPNKAKVVFFDQF